MTETLPFIGSDLLERVRAIVPAAAQAYLVGGAVRDSLLHSPLHDLDFVIKGDPSKIARRVADALHGAYFLMDEIHPTARVILEEAEGSRIALDFASLRGPNLVSDLLGRDFTINAMALPLHQPGSLIDPLGGEADLRAGILRACSENTFTDDPLRILRAIRQAAQFGFRIQPATRAAIHNALPRLPQVSPERVRDEFFRILSLKQPSAALRALDALGVLAILFPELTALKGVSQSPPHVADVWNHTLDAIRRLESLLIALSRDYETDMASNLMLGLVSFRLGRYREQLHEHLAVRLNPDRDIRSLLFMAALYHDVGKPSALHIDMDRRIRFFDHEKKSAQVIDERSRWLHLNNAENDRLVTIARHHMRPLLLAQADGAPTQRAIYRFFKDTGAAGVDICLLSLADVLATYGSTLPQDTWARQIEVVRALLEAWWDHHQQNVSPPRIVSGKELMEEFGLEAGPQIGVLLEAVREAQVENLVQDRFQALALVAELIMGKSHPGKAGKNSDTPAHENSLQ